MLRDWTERRRRTKTPAGEDESSTVTEETGVQRPPAAPEDSSENGAPHDADTAA
jgi:hypothetical protein